MALTIALALIITALAAGIAFGVVYADNRNLRREIVALKEAAHKHLPYPTAEAIENTFAALNAMEFDIAFKKVYWITPEPGWEPPGMERLAEMKYLLIALALIVLALFYFFIWALCAISASADRHIEESLKNETGSTPPDHI